MSAQQVSFLVPRAVQAPRGALWAAALATQALAGLHRLAAQALRKQPAAAAATPDSSPAQRAIEAAKVRELAFSYLKRDPGFAGDLLAAADRHERSGDD